MTELYYLQDKRSYVGNDLLFWAKDSKGYTTDVRRAEVFTREEALRQNRDRDTDVPWPKDYIDAKTRPAVDVQLVELEEALAGHDMQLKQPKPYVRPTYRCYGCGQFLKEVDYYTTCPNCESENRP